MGGRPQEDKMEGYYIGPERRSIERMDANWDLQVERMLDNVKRIMEVIQTHNDKEMAELRAELTHLKERT